MALTIRKASRTDAAAISRVIVATIEQSNAKDYPASVIESLPQHFSPEQIAQRMITRKTYVAVEGEAVVATASLDGMTVRSVFVLPDYQKVGVGLALMARIEQVACQQSMTMLKVPSSVTAEGFYLRLGYVKVREVYEGLEKIIVLQKTLPLPA